MGQPLRQPEHRFTYRDYCSWPDDERWELIEGVAYAMTPAPGQTHQHIAGELFYQVYGFLKGKECKAFCAPFDVRLPEPGEADENAETVVQPDLLVVCDRSKLDERGCRGAPDFVVEIVSPSSAVRDQIEKVALYEKHGVKEYWIVHPADHILIVRTLEEGGRFGPPRIMEAKGLAQVGVLPGLEVDMDALFPQPAAE